MAMSYLLKALIWTCRIKITNYLPGYSFHNPTSLGIWCALPLKCKEFSGAYQATRFTFHSHSLHYGHAGDPHAIYARSSIMTRKREKFLWDYKKLSKVTFRQNLALTFASSPSFEKLNTHHETTKMYANVDELTAKKKRKWCERE